MVAAPHIPEDDDEDTARSKDRALFVERAVTAILHLSKTLDQGTLSAMAQERTDIGVLIRALSDAATLDTTSVFEDDPLAVAKARGLTKRQELVEREGGTLSASQVALLLGLSRQGVDQRRRSGKLLAFAIGRRGFRYPRWQFVDGGVIPGLERVLQILVDHDPWMRAAFFLNDSGWLAGQRPLDMLRRGNVDAVIQAAAGYGNHVAA